MNAQEMQSLLSDLAKAQKEDKREALDKRIYRQTTTGYESGTVIIFGNDTPVKEASDEFNGQPYSYPAVKAIIDGNVGDINLNKIIRATQALNPPSYEEHPFLGELAKCEKYQDVADLLAGKTITFGNVTRLEFEKFQSKDTTWRRCTIPEVVE